MTIETFIARLGHDPELDFEDTLAVIGQHYDYTPTAFDNGNVHNPAGSNEGSCKILAFALLNDLSDAQTLACFGRFHRDVLATPAGEDHANIRALMKTGLDGVRFAGKALQQR